MQGADEHKLVQAPNPHESEQMDGQAHDEGMHKGQNDATDHEQEPGQEDDDLAVDVEGNSINKEPQGLRRSGRKRQWNTQIGRDFISAHADAESEPAKRSVLKERIWCLFGVVEDAVDTWTTQYARGRDR